MNEKAKQAQLAIALLDIRDWVLVDCPVSAGQRRLLYKIDKAREINEAETLEVVL